MLLVRELYSHHPVNTYKSSLICTVCVCLSLWLIYRLDYRLIAYDLSSLQFATLCVVSVAILSTFDRRESCVTCDLELQLWTSLAVCRPGRVLIGEQHTRWIARHSSGSLRRPWAPLRLAESRSGSVTRSGAHNHKARAIAFAIGLHQSRHA